MTYEKSVIFFCSIPNASNMVVREINLTWSILHTYNGHVPFLLSGGINSYSANALKEFKHPRLAGYDLNSRFETETGEKRSGAYPDIFKRIKIITKNSNVMNRINQLFNSNKKDILSIYFLCR